MEGRLPGARGLWSPTGRLEAAGPSDFMSAARASKRLSSQIFSAPPGLHVNSPGGSAMLRLHRHVHHSLPADRRSNLR
jgi:hypothetical protein